MTDGSHNQLGDNDRSAWRRPPDGASRRSDDGEIEAPRQVSGGPLVIGLCIIAALLVLLVLPVGFSALFRNPDSAKIEEAEAFIAYRLKDPASAQFRNVSVDTRCVLGEVNAKNSLGGYTGYTGFFYNLEIRTGEISMVDASLRDVDPLAYADASLSYANKKLPCFKPQ